MATFHGASFLHFSECPFPYLPLRNVGRINEIISSSSTSYQDADKVKLLAPSHKVKFGGALTEGENIKLL